MDEQGVQQFRAEVMARKNLPTIPTVLAKILQLVDAESSSGKELIAVIERDQALTGKMLRLANSAFFGQTRRVATIPRAVVLLGFSTVRNLALGVKVWDALGAGVARSRLEELWSHTVAVAVATKALAGRLRAGDPDEAFTAGLLHDVGRLVLAMRFRDEYWRAVGGASEAGEVEGLEAANLGVDHAEVGGWILEAWSLPPTIVEAVRHHHETASRPGIPGVLGITDRLVAWTDLATGTLQPEAEALLARLADRGITVALWRDVVAKLADDGELEALASLDT
ncbi:MAG TPA: HDOD domain-containing protein [Candidatus Binatia bacterium]|nr:HDOD domain-containing protein [Candidatus Binatia bacterium]